MDELGGIVNSNVDKQRVVCSEKDRLRVLFYFFPAKA
jgi:hypothetical protein